MNWEIGLSGFCLFLEKTKGGYGFESFWRVGIGGPGDFYRARGEVKRRKETVK